MKDWILKLPKDDKNLIAVEKKYGETHKIEAVIGCEVILHELNNNQSVVWGDGKSYHFRLTEK